MFTLLKRIIKTGWLNLFRDRVLLISNLFILVMAILAVNSLFLLKQFSNSLISSIQEKVDVSVYFKLETPEDNILKAKDEIAGVPEVKKVSYVSKEEAMNNFVEKHKNEPVLMQSIDEIGINPFLSSLNIQAFQASQYQAITNFLDNADFNSSIEKVDYVERQPIIEKISSINSKLNKGGIIFSVFLIVIAIAIVFNAVRLAIYSSREEIKVQRLVGASNWFIRGPFIIQGALAGFFAALISLLIFFLVCWFLNGRMVFLFPNLNLIDFFLNNLQLIILVQFLVGIGLGIISSTFAVRRYLRV